MFLMHDERKDYGEEGHSSERVNLKIGGPYSRQHLFREDVLSVLLVMVVVVVFLVVVVGVVFVVVAVCVVVVVAIAAKEVAMLEKRGLREGVCMRETLVREGAPFSERLFLIWHGQFKRQ